MFSPVSSTVIGLFGCYLVLMSGTQTAVDGQNVHSFTHHIEEIAKTIANLTVTLIGEVNQLASDLAKTGLTDALTDRIENTLVEIRSDVEVLVKESLEAIDHINKGLQGIKPSQTDLALVITKLIEPLFDLITGLVSALLKLLVSLGDSVAGRTVLKTINDLLLQADSLVKPLIQALNQLIKGSDNQLSVKVIQTVIKTVQSLSGLVQQIVGLLATPKLPDFAKGALNGVLTQIRDILSDMLHALEIPRELNKTVLVAVRALSAALEKAIALIPKTGA